MKDTTQHTGNRNTQEASMFRVHNASTGYQFFTTSLTDAQDYRDAHEGEVVGFWRVANELSGEVLIGESAARFAERQQKGGES
jgi:hypothetical protein